MCAFIILLCKVYSGWMDSVWSYFAVHKSDSRCLYFLPFIPTNEKIIFSLLSCRYRCPIHFLWVLVLPPRLLPRGMGSLGVSILELLLCHYDSLHLTVARSCKGKFRRGFEVFLCCENEKPCEPPVHVST